MKPRVLKWWVWPLLASFIAVVCPCCAVLFYSDISAWQNRVPFDPEVWRTAAPVDRYDMTWDLLHGKLDGKSQDEVKELLGEPMGKETLQLNQMPIFDPGPAQPGTIVWYYNIGYEKYEFRLGPTGALLAVDFVSGRVISVRKIVH